ncbi:carboxylate-amine ligase [Roseitalea porphyridii]|uniref:Putative glutamate--cysteine ligase 2 n=1 Tax=Roseitalea porphyridii TaxID=1852022 RepID=A0A4P6V2G4_9HYPH|nr:carboxylate-amine ligase [Roseitalea porphyridii]QBK31375.1 carboxylate-amine ligase [Roseitalea porphyridii]
MQATPGFTLGIEEEYLLVDADALTVKEAPDGLLEKLQDDLQSQVSPEYLQCQIEVGTGVCRDIAEARDDLRRLRSAVAKRAAEFNLAPIAVSCHPSAEWNKQHHTNKDRYNDLRVEMAAAARRLLICGMHVHVGIDDDALRVDLMAQQCYFLPHLLALSTSSPFWQGNDTGLASYRLGVFDNLPRTGLPPHFDSFAEYERTTGVLIDAGIIEDTTKVWWDLRPSARFPTLETRICDMSPRLGHAIAIAALVQAITRMLWRLRSQNMRWRIYDRFLISENRWRAQRYGITEGLIDYGRGEVVPFGTLLDELLELVTPDAAVLGSMRELDVLREIVAGGTSATRQRAVREAVGSDDADAINRAVVGHLIEEFHADL